MRERYTIRDAANRREPREYAQKLLRLARDADLSQLKNQLDLMYNGIELEVRQSDIRRPKDGTSLNDFLSDIDDVKHDWWTRGAKHRSGGQATGSKLVKMDYKGPQLGQYGQYGSNRQGNQGSGYQNRSNRFNQSYQSFQPRSYNQYGQQAYSNQSSQQRQGYPSYQGNQQGQYGQYGQNQNRFGQAGQNQSSNARQPAPLPPTPQRLQITAGQTSVDGSNSPNRQPLRPFGSTWQPRQQRAYQASVENEASKPDENTDSQEQGTYYGSSYQDSEHESDSVEEYEGQDVNFVAVASETVSEHACSNCFLIFSSRNLLFKHLRQQC